MAKTLTEQFAFESETPVIGNLDRLLVALEARFQALEKPAVTIDGVVANLTEVALSRMNDVFTPLILDAQQRLEQFGANFSAAATGANDVELGLHSFTIAEDERDGFVFADYFVARADADNAMLLQTDSYDRDTGLLAGVAKTLTGSGTFSAWEIRLGTVPDLDHAARTDNPHETTAAQVGAYTTAESDAAAVAAANEVVAGYGFMRQSANLADLTDKAAARTALNLPALFAALSGANFTGNVTAPYVESAGNVAARNNLYSYGGVIYGDSSGTKFLWLHPLDGGLYFRNSAGSFSSVWNSGNLATPVNGVRMAFLADYDVNPSNPGMQDPYPAAVASGFVGQSFGSSIAIKTIRYRVVQYLVSGTWYNVGNV